MMTVKRIFRVKGSGVINTPEFEIKGDKWIVNIPEDINMTKKKLMEKYPQITEVINENELDM